MKIGIFSYRQSPYISANTSIAYTVGNELKKQGHEIVFIGYRQNENQKNVTEYNGTPIRFLNDRLFDENGFIRLKIRRVFGYAPIMRGLARGLNRIIKDEKIERLICVTAPSDTALIAVTAKMKIPAYLYQLDPYYNGGDRVNPKLKREFLSVCRSFEHIFTTSLLYKEYQNEEIIKKCSVLEFPKLTFCDENTNKYKHPKPYLLYAGSLYRDIRSPKILIELKKNLPPDYDLIFCGSTDFKEDEKYLSDSGIICLGYLSQERLKSVVKGASFVINVGNSVKNQLGSKLIDCLASQKPIINITQFENCPTLDILNKHPCFLSLSVNEIGNKADDLTDFLNQNKSVIIDKKTLIDIYPEFTPEYVAKQIIDIL